MSICLESGVYDTFRRPVESSATNGDRKEEEAFREGEKERIFSVIGSHASFPFDVRSSFFFLRCSPVTRRVGREKDWEEKRSYVVRRLNS